MASLGLRLRIARPSVTQWSRSKRKTAVPACRLLNRSLAECGESPGFHGHGDGHEGRQLARGPVADIGHGVVEVAVGPAWGVGLGVGRRQLNGLGLQPLRAGGEEPLRLAEAGLPGSDLRRPPEQDGQYLSWPQSEPESTTQVRAWSTPTRQSIQGPPLQPIVFRQRPARQAPALVSFCCRRWKNGRVGRAQRAPPRTNWPFSGGARCARPTLLDSSATETNYAGFPAGRCS